MTSVEFHSYDDDGSVVAETVLTLDDTEFVIVETEGKDTHDVYEREIGATQPHTKYVEEGSWGLVE